MKCPTPVLTGLVAALVCLSCNSTPRNSTVTIRLLSPAGDALAREDCYLWVDSVGEVAEERGLRKGVVIIKKDPVGMERFYSGSYHEDPASGTTIDVTCSPDSFRVDIRSSRGDLAKEVVESLERRFDDHDGSFSVESRRMSNNALNLTVTALACARVAPAG